MVASFREFRQLHRSEHETAFNRWSAVVGNAAIILGTARLLLRRRRDGAASLLIGGAILAAGHAVEGNLPRALRDLARHPIWSVRADVELASDVIVRRAANALRQ